MNTTPIRILCAGLLALAAAAYAEPRYVTLTAESYGSNVFNVLVGETAEVVSFPLGANHAANRMIRVEKGNLSWEWRRIANSEPEPAFWSPSNPVAVTGPARVILSGGVTNSIIANSPALCTLRITPDQYPPTGTIVIPPGVGGGVVQLECSTNLVAWQVATNGLYTNLPAAKFFRLTLDRLP